METAFWATVFLLNDLFDFTTGWIVALLVIWLAKQVAAVVAWHVFWRRFAR
jgi:hypothetical protein